MLVSITSVLEYDQYYHTPSIILLVVLVCLRKGGPFGVAVSHTCTVGSKYTINININTKDPPALDVWTL